MCKYFIIFFVNLSDEILSAPFRMEGGEYRIPHRIDAMIEIVHRHIDPFLLLVLLPFVVAQLLDHVV